MGQNTRTSQWATIDYSSPTIYISRTTMDHLNRDIWATITFHLRDFPVDLLRLSLVNHAANLAISTLFPILLAERAAISCKVNHGKLASLLPY